VLPQCSRNAPSEEATAAGDQHSQALRRAHPLPHRRTTVITLSPNRPTHIEDCQRHVTPSGRWLCRGGTATGPQTGGEPRCHYHRPPAATAVPSLSRWHQPAHGSGSGTDAVRRSFLSRVSAPWCWLPAREEAERGERAGTLGQIGWGNKTPMTVTRGRNLGHSGTQPMHGGERPATWLATTQWLCAVPVLNCKRDRRSTGSGVQSRGQHQLLPSQPHRIHVVALPDLLFSTAQQSTVSK